MPILDDQGRFRGDHGMTRDATGRSRLAASLEESERRYRTLVEASPDAILTHQDGRVVFANPAATRVFGCTDASELHGRELAGLFRPASRTQVRDRLMRLDGNVPDRAIELQVDGPDGRAIVVEAAAAAVTEAGEPAVQIILRDVTERRRMAQRLRESERRLAFALEGAREGLWDWSVVSGETFFSPRAERLLGFDAGGLRPHIEAWRERFHPDDRLRVAETLNRHLHGELPRFEAEHRVLRRDGRWIWVNSRAQVAERDPSGQPTRVVGMFADVTERKRAQMEIERLAMHDPLTGLPNRAKFDDELALACERAARTGNKVALMCLDLDYFKRVNDTLGHPGGDVLLVEVAARLRECVRRTDLVARLGGDEFAVIAGEQKGTEACGHLATRIIDALAAPYAIQGMVARTAASIGITVYPDDTGAPEQLLADADMALYLAKDDGGRTWRRYDAGTPVRFRSRRVRGHVHGEIELPPIVSPADAEAPASDQGVAPAPRQRLL